MAYGGSDFKPYYRYLHEDAMGNTVATTDQWANRRDEYDYTDYGVPIHAPIVFDGRWVASIAPHGSFSVISWEGYPTMVNVPRPTGPFRILRGAEYRRALAQKKAANQALHRRHPELSGYDFHEIHPVKFGGDPVGPSNKVPLLPHEHLPYTRWWAQRLRNIGG